MRFFYNPTFGYEGIDKKELKPWRVEEIRKALVADKYSHNWTFGRLNDFLMAFRFSDGKRLMVHQAEPIFIFLARTGEVWDELS